jgi:hypothetical protein
MAQKIVNAFWGEMSACEHFVQVYESDSAFMDTLADFIGNGLIQGEASIVIATPQHRLELDKRLKVMGIDVQVAQSQGQFISIDAEETLESFLINGWPDDRRFNAFITGLLQAASRDGKKVRAFGEMVALMWAQGHCGATVRLEQLWTNLCKRESLPLFCAYPKVGFTEDASKSIARVCAEHSKVLAARPV